MSNKLKEGKALSATPGPWIYEDILGHQAVHIGGDQTLHLDSKANAHLIAAAPELLEALKKLHEKAGEIKGYWTGQGQAVERLIAKAQGGR